MAFMIKGSKDLDLTIYVSTNPKIATEDLDNYRSWNMDNMKNGSKK